MVTPKVRDHAVDREPSHYGRVTEFVLEHCELDLKAPDSLEDPVGGLSSNVLVAVLIYAVLIIYVFTVYTAQRIAGSSGNTAVSKYEISTNTTGDLIFEIPGPVDLMLCLMSVYIPIVHHRGLGIPHWVRI